MSLGVYENRIPDRYLNSFKNYDRLKNGPILGVAGTTYASGRKLATSNTIEIVDNFMTNNFNDLIITSLLKHKPRV